MFSVPGHLLVSNECFNEILKNSLITTANQVLCNVSCFSFSLPVTSLSVRTSFSSLVLICLGHKLGLSNLDCLAVFQTGFVLLGD